MKSLGRFTITVGLAAALAPSAALSNVTSLATVQCPFDGAEVSWIVDLSGTLYDTRLDHRPLGRLTVPPELPVCPHDGFIVLLEEFVEKTLPALANVVASPEYQRARAVDTSYGLLARLRAAVGATDQVLAYTYLSAAWESEDAGDEMLERSYLERASAHLLRHLGDHPSEVDLQLLAIELDRRLGRFALAGDRARRVLERLLADQKPQPMVLRIQLLLIGKGDSNPHSFSEFKELREDSQQEQACEVNRTCLEAR